MLATTIPSFQFSNIVPPKSHADNTLPIEINTADEETKKGIQLIQKTHFTDFIDYFTCRTPIPVIFSNFVFYIFIFQEIIIGLMPNLTRYWSNSKSTERFIRFLGYIFLVLSPPKDTLIFTIFFVIVVFFSLSSFILLGISRYIYQKHRTIPYKLCTVARYSIFLTTTILLPVHIAFYGEFLNHVFDIQEQKSLKSVSRLEFFAIIIFLIFLIFLFIYSLRILLFLHYSISFQTILFKIWQPWAIIRHYSTICVNVFIYHIFPKSSYTSNCVLPFIPTIMLIISFLNLLVEMFQANWVRHFDQIKVLTTLISNVVSSSCILIDILIYDKEGRTHPQEVLWCILTLSIIGAFLAVFLNKMSTKISMKRLNNPYYPYYVSSNDHKMHQRRHSNHRIIKKRLGGSSSDESVVSISSDEDYESDYYQERDSHQDNHEQNQVESEEIDYSSLKSIRFASTVFKDLCIGYMNNHPDVIRMKHVQRILDRFPHNTNINFFFAKQFFVFSSITPITFEKLMEHLRSNSFFSPVNEQIQLSISSSLGPITESSMERMIKEREKLNGSFFKLIHSIHLVYDLILYELTRSIPRAVLHFQHRYNKTLKLLFSFVQAYPGSKDATFFVNLFETFFPTAIERKELKYWLNNTPNYSMIDLSLFPSHISLLMNHPDWFKPYVRKYSILGYEDKKRNRTVPELFQFDSFHMKKRKQLDDVKGPYKYAIMKPLLLLSLFITIGFPLAMMFMVLFTDFTYLKRSDTLIQCYTYLWKLDMINSHLYPVVIFKNSTTFWTKNCLGTALIPDCEMYHNLKPSLGSLYDYKIEQLRFISDVQTDLLNFAKGLSPDIEKSMFNETSELFQTIDSDFIENRTLYQSILYITAFLGQNFLATDKIFFDKFDEDAYEIHILQSIWTKCKSLYHIYFDKLDDIQLFDNSLFERSRSKLHINPSIFLAIEYFFLIAGYIYLFLSMKFTVSRYELFFMTLRETSKPSVNMMLSACQRCQKLLGHAHAHDNKRLSKISPFQFYLHFTIPTVLLYFFLFVIIACFALVSNCFEFQTRDNVSTYDKLTQAYHNVTKLIIDIFLLQYSYNNVESNQTKALISEINEINEYYQGVSWFFETQFPSYCKLCSLVDMMMIVTPEIGNKTYFSAIFEWFGMSHFYVSKALYDEEIAINLIYNYLGEVNVILKETFDLSYTTIRKTIVDTIIILISLTILYILGVFVFIIIISLVVKKADSPFNNILKLLGRLPENALSKDTSKILSHHTWDFTLKQFQFDPLYYEQVLKMLPDAVIVIDRLMNIAYFNTAARKLINIQCDEEGFLKKHYKLFEIMAAELFWYDEEPHSSSSSYNISARLKTPPASSRSRTSASSSTSTNGSDAIPLCDIVEGYLLDDSCSILSQRVCTKRTTQNKHYYSLTIKPIDDDDSIDGHSRTFSSQKNEFTHFAIILKDIGEEIRQQKMLEQEADKLNQIVYQILPKQVAHQLMHNENVISMSVRNVAISFCDIVSFTPWCGSQSPQVVVKTLNSMFKIFDQMVSKYDQVTKIKCIGDCYVSAAGIFNSSITASDNLPVDSNNNILIRNPGIWPSPKINNNSSNIQVNDIPESNKSSSQFFNHHFANAIAPSKTQMDVHMNARPTKTENSLDLSRRTQSKQYLDHFQFESVKMPQTVSSSKLVPNDSPSTLPPPEENPQAQATRDLKARFKQDLRINLSAIHTNVDDNIPMNTTPQFNPNSPSYPTPPTQQEIIAAKQMLSFCLDMLDGIKIVNKQLGMNLQVRVGAAFGGPISAGVIGMRMPVFDIWGELVNEANKMEASGKAMTVHIKDNYYKLVCDEDYNFQPMTEEGNEGTYLVTRNEKP